MKTHSFVSEYHGPINHLAAPMGAGDFFCFECGEELWSCECNAKPYTGCDPSQYRKEDRR